MHTYIHTRSHCALYSTHARTRHLCGSEPLSCGLCRYRCWHYAVTTTQKRDHTRTRTHQRDHTSASMRAPHTCMRSPCACVGDGSVALADAIASLTLAMSAVRTVARVRACNGSTNVELVDTSTKRSSLHSVNACVLCVPYVPCASKEALQTQLAAHMRTRHT
jgi:hypothetical protein